MRQAGKSLREMRDIATYFDQRETESGKEGGSEGDGSNSVTTLMAADLSTVDSYKGESESKGTSVDSWLPKFTLNLEVGGNWVEESGMSKSNREQF